MDRDEFTALLGVWSRAGFHPHAMDFSGIDDELVRRLTATVDQWLLGQAATPGTVVIDDNGNGDLILAIYAKTELGEQAGVAITVDPNTSRMIAHQIVLRADQVQRGIERNPT